MLHVVPWHYSTKVLNWIPVCMPRRKKRPQFAIATKDKKQVDCESCLAKLKVST